MVDDYRTLSQEFDTLMAANTLRAVSKEDFRNPDQLPNISAEAMEDFASRCSDLAMRIANANAGETFDERIDLEVAAGELRAQVIDTIGDIDGSPRYAVNPLSNLSFFADGLLFFLERDPRSERERVDGLVRKLEQLPIFLEQGASRLDHPVETWRDMECEVAKGYGNMAQAIHSFAENAGYQDMSSLNAALLRAATAVYGYSQQLREMPTRRALSLGEDVTRILFQDRGIEISLEEMHRLATRDIEEKTGRIEDLRRRVVEKYYFPSGSSAVEVTQLLKAATECKEGTAVQVAEEILTQAIRFAYDQGIVHPLEGPNEARIAFTPRYLRPMVPSAAMYPPGSFAQGSRKSAYFITEREGNIMSRPALAGTVAHELIPGHHYQGVRATEHPSRIRGWLFPLDLVEGWTTRVAEQVMSERGFIGTPGMELEEQFFAEAGQLRLGARVYFVLGCLTGERKYLQNPFVNVDTEQDIVRASEKLYSSLTGFPESRANADVHLFSSMQQYGALYLTGNVLFHRMEAQAREKQGNSFRLADFHEAMLREGTLPLSAMQRSLEYKGIM
ncbi:DUF885 family protein [Candidatus Woesearchaeota archaeon]|nr:DUF885 family protein [Candidatus Woesearchaeota archaeon]